MRTFFISLGLFLLLLVWLLNKPIERQAREFRGFSAPELQYLERTFDYAMDNLPASKHYDWQTSSVTGRIAASEPFESQAKSICRAYTEVYVTSKRQGLTKGYGCKRQGKDGWCRLDAQDVQSCALEDLEWSVSKRARIAMMQGGQMIDQATGMVSSEANQLANDARNIHGPSIPDAPNVSMPSFSAPDIDLKDFRPPMPWDPEKK